jgi:hypothetical protein
VASGPDISRPVMLEGTWEVTFVLQRHPAVHLRWAPASISGATYTFIAVTITGMTHVEIQWRAQGPTVGAVNDAEREAALHAPQGTTSPAPTFAPGTDPMERFRSLWPQLIGPTG